MQTLKPPLRLALRVGLGLACLTLLFRQVPFEAVLQEFARVDPRLLAAAYALYFVTRALMAARTWILAEAQGLGVPYPQVYRINLSTSFYALFLPGGSAVFVRWYKLAHYAARRLDSLTTVVADRILDFVLIASIGCAFLLVDLRADALSTPRAGLLGVLASLLLCYALFFSQVLYRIGAGAVAALPLPHSLRSRGLELVRSMGRFSELGTRQHASIAVLSLVREGVSVVQIVLIAGALDLSLPVFTLIWARALAVTLSMLPISIGGLGLREGSFALLLPAYGVGPEAAVALGLLMFGGTLVVGLVGGALELAALFSSREGRGRPARGESLQARDPGAPS